MTSRRQFLRMGAALGGLGAVASIAACTDDADDASADDFNLGFAGTVLGIPLAKPTVTFTDTSGAPFDVAAATAGTLTLMLFGYTSCPDVCPVHLSILASTLDRIEGPAKATNVVFVGVDTARDTPDAIRAFLDNRDRDFIGLTATPDVIDEALTQLNLPAVTINEPAEDGSYTVGHPSQILAFGPDDLCHVVYPFGVVEQEWATDLPRLLTFDDWPS